MPLLAGRETKAQNICSMTIQPVILMNKNQHYSFLHTMRKYLLLLEIEMSPCPRMLLALTKYTLASHRMYCTFHVGIVKLLDSDIVK